MSDTKHKTPPRYTPELKQRAFALYCEELDWSLISEKTQVPVTRLHQWSSKEKWKLKRIKLKEDRTVMEAGMHTSTPEEEAELSNLTLTQLQDEYQATMQREAIKFARSLGKMPAALKLAASEKIEKQDKIARKALKLETDKPRTIINIGLLAGQRPPKRAYLVEQSAIESPTSEALAIVGATGFEPVTQGDTTHDDTLVMTETAEG